MASSIEDVSSPLRRCRTCGQDKPWNLAHFGRRTRKRADGSQVPAGWYWDCKPCRIINLEADREARKQRKRLEKAHAVPPPLYEALKQPGVKRPALPPEQRPFDFRAVLQNKARQKWPKLADKMIDTALGSNKDSAAMLKLVASYVLGPPREAGVDDNGPGRFWSALLAGPGPGDPGPDPDVGSEEEDLVDDPGAAG